MNYANHDELLQRIGENLRIIRIIRKEKLQGVAQCIGVSHPVLSKIENGRSANLTIALLANLCNYYRVCILDVFQPEQEFHIRMAKNRQYNAPKP
ncbi:helix-turn-helix domain-containing protein [Niabella insulamsoli]|uniref:helix-turn-helix domain-containing protein n=1 Tax=Niabella insulamsoli TaxID=3144874 RepID=UPI0031FC88C4